MGQTMDQSTSPRPSTQKMPQSKNNSGKGAEKKAKSPDAATTHTTEVNVDTRSKMAKFAAKISPEQRQHMIEEAAYYRAEQRGFCCGNEIQDWLDAEAEIDSKLPR